MTRRTNRLFRRYPKAFRSGPDKSRFAWIRYESTEDIRCGRFRKLNRADDAQVVIPERADALPEDDERVYRGELSRQCRDNYIPPVCFIELIRSGPLDRVKPRNPGCVVVII